MSYHSVLEDHQTFSDCLKQSFILWNPGFQVEYMTQNKPVTIVVSVPHDSLLANEDQAKKLFKELTGYEINSITCTGFAVRGNSIMMYNIKFADNVKISGFKLRKRLFNVLNFSL